MAPTRMREGAEGYDDAHRSLQAQARHRVKVAACSLAVFPSLAYLGWLVVSPRRLVVPEGLPPRGPEAVGQPAAQRAALEQWAGQPKIRAVGASQAAAEAPAAARLADQHRPMEEPRSWAAPRVRLVAVVPRAEPSPTGEPRRSGAAPHRDRLAATVPPADPVQADPVQATAAARKLERPEPAALPRVVVQPAVEAPARP